MTFDTFVNAENNAAANAASNAFGVKVSYGNEIRRAACAEPSYAALCEVVAKLFELGEPAKLTLKYQDEDGDKVTMSSDIELQEAIRLSKNAKKIIRLFVETNTKVKEEEMKPADPDVVEVEGPADHWRDVHAGRGGWGGRGGMWGGRGGMSAWGGRGGGFHHGPLHHARFPPHHGPFPHAPFGRGFHHGPYGSRGGFGCPRGGFGAHGRFGGPCADPTAAPAPAPAAEGENVNAPAQDANANPAPADAPEDVRFAPPPFHHPHPHPHGHGPWGHGHWGAGAWGGEEMRKAMKERKQAMKEHRKAMKDHLEEMKSACQTKEDKEAIKAFKEAMKEEWKDAWKEMKKAHKEDEKEEKKERKGDKHHGDKHDKHHDKHDKHHGEKHYKKHGEKCGARDESGERLMARHVADVTIPDNSLLPADTPVTKTWRLKNVGTVAWPAESQLIFVSRHGDNLNGPERVPVAGPVEPGQEVDVSVPFITPAEPGRYVGYYRMATADGMKFGQRVWVSFLIPAAPANTTVATAPAAPATPTAPTVMDL